MSTYRAPLIQTLFFLAVSVILVATHIERLLVDPDILSALGVGAGALLFVVCVTDLIARIRQQRLR